MINVSAGPVVCSVKKGSSAVRAKQRATLPVPTAAAGWSAQTGDIRHCTRCQQCHQSTVAHGTPHAQRSRVYDKDLDARNELAQLVLLSRCRADAAAHVECLEVLGMRAESADARVGDAEHTVDGEET